MLSKMQDILSFIKTLNFHKVYNIFLLLFSYYRSRILGKPRIAGMPASMSIEPTTACNLRCPQCPSGLRSFSRPTGSLSMELYQKIIDENQQHLSYLMLYFQGEPYIHPQFTDMIAYASARNIYTATSTNAHFLSEKNAEKTVLSGLNRLIISLDGTTQDVYEKYRVEGNLEKVKEGLRNLQKAKEKYRSRKPYTILQFVVFRHNEHQMDDARNLKKSYGADALAFKTAQIYDFTEGSEWLPSDPLLSRYSLTDSGVYAIKNKLLNHCWKMWHGCVITRDGSVVPCCFDKDATQVLGNLNSHTMPQIWHGEKYVDFRDKLFISRKKIDICTNCTEGTKVWL
ncbi:MAG: SPASM domain-containing protein [Cyclobacteriaceae bacterium]|nr:SPASM domain-containing protein [Cyclobacteriaceae bacterium]